MGFRFIQTDDEGECELHDELLDDPKANWSPNENLISFVPDWEDWEACGYDPDAFAVAMTFFVASTGQIVNADIDVNDSGSNGNIGLCGDDSGKCGGDTVDLKNVLTHEIGHMLGLGHSDKLEAVMYDKALLGETNKRKLTSDDIEGLCSSYPEGSLLDCEILEDAGCSCSSVGGHAASAIVQGSAILLVLGVGWRMRQRRRNP